MKKTVLRMLAVMLVCAAVVGLAACGKKNGSGGSSALNTQPPAQTQEHTVNTPNPNPQGREDASSIGSKVTEAPAGVTQQPADGGDHFLGPAGPTTYVVSSEDGFVSSGFTCFKAGKTTKLDVLINTNNGAVEWSVYVLDEEFTDSLRYLPQAYEPTMTDGGELSVEAGQFVYVYCSVNSFTASEPARGATVSFFGEGLPKN